MAGVQNASMLLSSVTSTVAPPSAFSNPVSPEYIKELASNLDQFFLVVNGIIIFYIQAGFAFLEAGSVRSKNTTNILLKNLLDTLIGGIAYWLFGHAFAFGAGNTFIGYTNWPIYGLKDTEYAHWFFQFVYASTSSSIVSGAVAERCSLVAYLSYTTLISGIIYPTCCHWAWSPDGWLQRTAFHDFAGSGVVHSVGGSASLIACLILGPRTDIFHPVTGKKRLVRGHSVALAALGCFTLFFGIMAFNAATLGHISQVGDGGKISLAVTNTVLSGASGGLAALGFRRMGWFLNEKYEQKSWSFLLTINGMFVGMVSVCGGCDNYPTWAAVVCGIVAAVVFLNIRRLTQSSKYIDDPLDAIAVHFGGGWWGMICAALLTRNGLFLSGNKEILLWNLAGNLSFMCWAWLLVGSLFLTLRFFGLHRVSVEEELAGMDMAKHHEPAYPLDEWIDRLSAAMPNNRDPKRASVAGLPPYDSRAGLVHGEITADIDDFDYMMREFAKSYRYPIYQKAVNATSINNLADHQQQASESDDKAVIHTSAANSRKASMAGLNTFDTAEASSSDKNSKPQGGKPSFGKYRSLSMRFKKLQEQQDDGDEEAVYKTVR